MQDGDEEHCEVASQGSRRTMPKMEDKETLRPSDKRKIKHLLKQVKSDDKELEERHLEVLNHIKEEDQEALDAEEVVYDAHGSHMMEIIERLEQLEVVESQCRCRQYQQRIPHIA